MDGIKLSVFTLGELQTNCYVIYNKTTKNAIVIDAPGKIEEVKKFIEKNNLNLLFVLLTHGHFDHIEGLLLLDTKFYIHRNDLTLLKDPNLNASYFFGIPFSIEKEPTFYEEKTIEFDSYPIEVIHTPGHTPGSVCFKIGDWLFSGDTIFFDSVGRTDIALGSEELLFQSIHKKILPLPDETIIYPGHGISTTLEREKKFNPFLNSSIY